jgi:hypothetical protein
MKELKTVIYLFAGIRIGKVQKQRIFPGKQIIEMIKYLIEFKLIQFSVRFCKLTFIVFIISLGFKTFAQNSSVAIINLADSNLLYKHIGLSGFKDKIDTIDCRFNSRRYIDKELTRILSFRYSVSLPTIPNNLLSSNGSIYNSLDINNEVKLWISSVQNKYDFVIFVETGEQDDIMDTKKQKIRSSGLYSRGNPTKSWVAVFSTTRFTLVRTSNSEVVDYDWSGMDYILPLTDYQFSRNDLLIDPEMISHVKDELIKLIDYKLEYFLVNTFLMPDGDYKNLKTQKTD